jgi:hypothetical protein
VRNQTWDLESKRDCSTPSIPGIARNALHCRNAWQQVFEQLTSVVAGSAGGRDTYDTLKVQIRPLVAIATNEGI